MSDQQAESRQRGRPRSEVSHQAVLDAAARLLDNEGISYEELTVERIAAEAAVGKQTIYRWWPNKAAVVLEALLTGRLQLNYVPIPNTGDLRADLMAWVDDEVKQAQMQDSVTMARSLMAALVTSGEDTQQLVRANPIWDVMELTDRIRAEAEAGRLRPGVNPADVASAIMDPVIVRMVSVGAPEASWMRSMLAIVLDGVLGD